jgi:hypothetical protein
MNDLPLGHEYPAGPHTRRHGPIGYVDYASYREWLRDEFTFRCTYCLARERWGPVLGEFDLDHFVPQARSPSLDCTYDNLLYLCHRCNLKKGSHSLPDPCRISLRDCIRVHEDGRIEALDRSGKRIIRILALEDPNWVHWRAMLIATFKELKRTHSAILRNWLGFPDDLPDLAAMRPSDNSRPDGISKSYLNQRLAGTLPEFY